MQESNSSAALIVDASGVLEGIITDSDVTRKVLAKRLDPAKVCVADAMTRSPKSVTDEDNASQALSIMVEGKFRHLPVLGSGQAAGKLCGVLDVVKCLFDAISTIESSHLPGGQVTLELLLAAVAAGHLDAASSSASPTSSGSPTSSAMVHVSHEDAAAAVSGKDAASEAAGADEPHHTTSRWEAVTARFSLFRSSSKSGNGSSDSGGSSSTSSSAASSPAADVRPTILPSASVQKAAEQMAARKGAVLVSEATQRRVGRDYFGLGLSSSSSSSSASAVGVSSCAGVLTPKDVLYRVLARGLDPSHTQVCQVMTPSPDCISSSATILDALHQLQGAGYRQLPVLDATTGAPVGVVDVLTLIQGAMLLGQPSSNSPAAKADPSTFSTSADTVAAPAAGATAATAASAASAPATAATKGLRPRACPKSTWPTALRSPDAMMRPRGRAHPSYAWMIRPLHPRVRPTSSTFPEPLPPLRRSSSTSAPALGNVCSAASKRPRASLTMGKSVEASPATTWQDLPAPKCCGSLASLDSPPLSSRWRPRGVGAEGARPTGAPCAQ